MSQKDVKQLMIECAQLSAKIFSARFQLANKYVRENPHVQTRRAAMLAELLAEHMTGRPRNWPYLGQLLDDLLAELDLL